MYHRSLQREKISPLLHHSSTRVSGTATAGPSARVPSAQQVRSVTEFRTTKYVQAIKFPAASTLARAKQLRSS
jgi:hypothetical protein